MGIKHAEKFAVETPGYLSKREGRLLYWLALKQARKGKVVEIGSWKGRSTIWLAEGNINGGGMRVFAIDPHTGSPELPEGNTFKEFVHNLKHAGLFADIVLIVKTSEEAAKRFKDGEVSFLFIDGSHSYKNTRQDFDLWFPKIAEHGIMAFHDTLFFDAPKNIVRKEFFKSTYFRKIGFVDSTVFAEKVSRNTGMERAENYCVWFLKEVYAVFCLENIRLTALRIIKRKS